MAIVEAAGRRYLSGEVRWALYGEHGLVFGLFLKFTVARMVSDRPMMLSGYKASSASRRKDSVGFTLPRTAFLRRSGSFPQLTCFRYGEGTGLRLGEGGHPSISGITVGDTYGLNESSFPWGSSFSEEAFDMASSSVGVFMYDCGPLPYGSLLEGVEGWVIVASALD